MEKKKLFLWCTHQKYAIMGFCFLQAPKGNQAGVSLHFNQVCAKEDLCQILYFIQNLHYNCTYTPTSKESRLLLLLNSNC